MKLLYFFSIIFLSSLTGGDISQANRYKESAHEAYRSGNYELAIEQYSYLLDSLSLNDPALALNLGHAYYKHIKSTKSEASLKSEQSKADQKMLAETGMLMLDSYIRAAASQDKELKASAYHQLGLGFMELAKVVNYVGDEEKEMSMEERFKEALGAFKTALKNDPYNEDTRYNYELVKKLFEEFKKQKEENKKQNKQDQKQQKEEEKEDKKNEEDKNKQEDKEEEQKNKGDKGEEQKDEEGKDAGERDESKEEKGEADKQQEGDPTENGEGKEKKEGGEAEGGKEGSEDKNKKDKAAAQKQMRSKRLKEINMNKEKARMILEAMKAQEMQYYQNMRKGVRKPKNTSKPDW